MHTASFDGVTFDPTRDTRRLTAQHHRVKALMRDGRWRTLAEISEATGDPEASVSARLRDFRKTKFGGHGVDRQYVERGLYRYKLVLNLKDLFEESAH